jgi:hypothetical protein
MDVNTKKERKLREQQVERCLAYAETLINPPAPSPSEPLRWSNAPSSQVSDGWIKRYTFSLDQELVLGCAEDISMTANPAVDFHADRFFTNAPFRSFAILHNIVFANVCITIGGGEDAFHYQRARSLDNPLTFPMVTPASRIGVKGSYTGRRSKLYADGPFRFVATFQGKARDIS